jgi:hypothetical protein
MRVWGTVSAQKKTQGAQVADGVRCIILQRVVYPPMRATR